MEDVLMRNRAPVSHLVGHRTRLNPHIVISDQPALVLHTDRKSVRDQEKLLGSGPRSVTREILRTYTKPTCPLLDLCALVRPLPTPIRISQVNPKAASVLQYLPAEIKYFGQLLDKLTRMLL